MVVWEKYSASSNTLFVLRLVTFDMLRIESGTMDLVNDLMDITESFSHDETTPKSL